MNYAKLPFTCYNITSVNNTFRYSMDDVPTWEVLTLDTGIYDLDLLQAGIRYYLRVAGDYTADPTSHTSLDLYPFSIHFNTATGKSYFLIVATTKHLDLTNNGTSTFYEFLGFTSADNNLTGALQYVSTNQASLLQALSNFKITCNLAQTHSSKYYSDGVLYNSSWKVAPYSAQEVNNHETSKIALKDEIKEIRDIRVKVLDSDNNLITFNGPTTDSNLQISLYIN